MHKTSCAAVAATALVVPAIVGAEEEPDPTPKVFPVEIYTCDFLDGMGPTELGQAIEAWNEFLDDRELTTYFAATLTPYYFGSDSFDFAWLGAWSDGEAMGVGTDTWLEEGGAYARRFADVATCDTHTNFASVSVKRPIDDDDTADSFVLTFSDCKLVEGQSMASVFAGIGEFVAYQNEMGYPQGTRALFPAYGGGDADYDFKMVDGFDNYTELGKVYELFTNGGGSQRHAETTAHLLSCDTARVYNATTRRRMATD